MDQLIAFFCFFVGLFLYGNQQGLVCILTTEVIVAESESKPEKNYQPVENKRTDSIKGIPFKLQTLIGFLIICSTCRLEKSLNSSREVSHRIRLQFQYQNIKLPIINI